MGKAGVKSDTVEHSFKNLKEEFAFWDKNPNRSTQPDTLKNIFL